MNYYIARVGARMTIGRALPKPLTWWIFITFDTAAIGMIGANYFNRNISNMEINFRKGSAQKDCRHQLPQHLRALHFYREGVVAKLQFDEKGRSLVFVAQSGGGA